MKTLIASLTTAALLGIASYLTSTHTDAAVLTTIAFTSGLVGWTFSLYGREKNLEISDKIVRFRSARPNVAVARRLAA